jgi:hypothetical protein
MVKSKLNRWTVDGFAMRPELGNSGIGAYGPELEEHLDDTSSIARRISFLCRPRRQLRAPSVQGKLLLSI